MARGPLRPHKVSLLHSLYGEHLEQQLKTLCGRLGVDYSDNETAATGMWAEIGERLALQQPEFMSPRTRGRPKVLVTREMQLADAIESLQRDDPTLSDAAAVKKHLAGTHYSDKSVLPQLSRGKTRLSQIREQLDVDGLTKDQSDWADEDGAGLDDPWGWYRFEF